MKFIVFKVVFCGFFGAGVIHKCPTNDYWFLSNELSLMFKRTIAGPDKISWESTLYLKQVAFYKPQATCKAYKDKADSFLSQSAAMSFWSRLFSPTSRGPFPFDFTLVSWLIWVNSSKCFLKALAGREIDFFF